MTEIAAECCLGYRPVPCLVHNREVKASSLLLAAVLLSPITCGRPRGRTAYVELPAAGIREGAPVLFHGFEIGTVQKVALRRSGVIAVWIAIQWRKFRDHSWNPLAIGSKNAVKRGAAAGLFLATAVVSFGVIYLALTHAVPPLRAFQSAPSSASQWTTRWVLMVIVAPVTEELFARGFLYRGWSESFLGPVGAILLSSAVWTALHLQYDWYFFGEVFSIGLLLGYLRYRFHSIWLTIILHGLNNLAAVVQTIWLAGST